jgi:hypothetical protein
MKVKANVVTSSNSTNTNTNTNTKVLLSDPDTSNPNWIYEYIIWHTKQRTLFPDTQLLTNKNAPSILIVYFNKYSEGLAGRFNELPSLLWFVYERNLLLLITFYNPLPIENFLIPPTLKTIQNELNINITNINITTKTKAEEENDDDILLSSSSLWGWNWTVPIIINRTDTSENLYNYYSDTGKGRRGSVQSPHYRRKKYIFDFPNRVDIYILNVLKFDVYKDRIPWSFIKSLSSSSSSRESESESEQQEIPFKTYWKIFFRPSYGLQKVIDETNLKFNLIPKQYDAIHCRILHPAHLNLTEHNNKIQQLDKQGMYHTPSNIIQLQHQQQSQSQQSEQLQQSQQSEQSEQSEQSQQSQQQREQQQREIILRQMKIAKKQGTLVSSNPNTIIKENTWLYKRNDAIQTAIHSIQCSNWLALNYYNSTTTRSTNVTTATTAEDETVSNNTTISTKTQVKEDEEEREGIILPTYFFSDSLELVREIIDISSSSSASSNNKNSNNTNSNSSSIGIIDKRNNIFGRYDAPVSHIERINQSIETYYSTFVDLYIASNARCITMGVGKFGYFASLISDNDNDNDNDNRSKDKKCLLIHEYHDTDIMSRWGYEQRLKNVNVCPI